MNLICIQNIRVGCQPNFRDCACRSEYIIRALLLVIAIYTRMSISGVVFWRINGWLDSSSSRGDSRENLHTFLFREQEHFWNWISHCSVKLWCTNIPEDNHCLRFRLVTVNDCWKCQSIMETILLLDITFRETDLLIQTCWCSCYTGAKLPMLVLHTIHSGYISHKELEVCYIEETSMCQFHDQCWIYLRRPCLFTTCTWMPSCLVSHVFLIHVSNNFACLGSILSTAKKPFWASWAARRI